LTHREPPAREPPAWDGPERRAAPPADDGAFAGLPLWSRVAAMVGIPGTIAFFLVWVGAQSLPAIKTDLAAYHAEAERNHQLYVQALVQQAETYRLLQRICSNVSKTDEERQRCFDK
jgi:hypothetical protein